MAPDRRQGWIDDLVADLDRVPSRRDQGSQRLVGRVVGTPPASLDAFYLVNPVSISGAEVEGGPATLSVDSSRTIPVAVLGGHKPTLGGYLIVHDVSDRWVAEPISGDPPLSCYPCNLPPHDLTLSWVNPLVGNGSTPFVYSPGGGWATGCFNGMLAWMVCSGGTLQFGVTYFISGSCPTGQQQTCSSTGSPPFGLKLSSYACSPLSLVYTASGFGCPVLASGGYASFTVTDP